MISSNDLRNASLTQATNGYDINEVNALLDKAASAIESYTEENAQLYHKMEVLAAKIEEYRAEEDSIKEALISAQKTANKIRQDSETESETLLQNSRMTADKEVDDAKAEAGKIINDAQTYAETHVRERTAEAAAIVEDAERKANEAITSSKIVAQNVMDQAKEISEDLITKSKEEKNAYDLLVAALKRDAQTIIGNLQDLYSEQLARLEAVSVDTPAYSEEHVQAMHSEVDSLVSEMQEMEQAVPEEVVIDKSAYAIPEDDVEEAALNDEPENADDMALEEETETASFEADEAAADEATETEPEPFENENFETETAVTDDFDTDEFDADEFEIDAFESEEALSNEELDLDLDELDELLNEDEDAQADADAQADIAATQDEEPAEDFSAQASADFEETAVTDDNEIETAQDESAEALSFTDEQSEAEDMFDAVNSGAENEAEAAQENALFEETEDMETPDNAADEPSFSFAEDVEISSSAEEDVTDPMQAVEAFSTDEITPIDFSKPFIPEISEEPQMERDAQSLFDETEKLPFENFFNVNTNDAHFDKSQTISLVPPEEDDTAADDSKFKGFFKKKK